VTNPPTVTAADTATAGPDRHRPTGRDVRRFWWAYSIDQLGSGIGSGALPLVAILVLNVSDLQASMLAVLAGIASVVVTVPLGPWIEFHRKRPSMIAADLLRFATLAAVPVSAACGVLTYAQLCLTAVAQTTGAIVSSAAATAYVKGLVPSSRRATVNSRLETTFWTSSTLGPPTGGLLASVAGPLASITVDAVSFALATVGLRRIRHVEPVPSVRTAGAPLAQGDHGRVAIHRRPPAASGIVCQRDASFARSLLLIRRSSTCRQPGVGGNESHGIPSTKPLRARPAPCTERNLGDTYILPRQDVMS
jgi:Major Facilitator Superfamily